MDKMPKMTISLSREDEKKLKELSKKERRPYSNQIVYMMEFYIENKNKIK